MVRGRVRYGCGTKGALKGVLRLDKRHFGAGISVPYWTSFASPASQEGPLGFGTKTKSSVALLRCSLTGGVH